MLLTRGIRFAAVNGSRRWLALVVASRGCLCTRPASPQHHRAYSSAAEIDAPSQLWRSFMYVPGHKQRMIAGLRRKPAPDVAVFDLEDGVAPDDKTQARRTVCQLLSEADRFHAGCSLWGLRSSRAVRINPRGAPEADEDLLAVLGAPLLQTLVLPKLESQRDLDWLLAGLTSAARPESWPSLRLVVMIESPAALLAMQQLLSAASGALPAQRMRLEAAVFGSDDYCATLGVPRTAAGAETAFARRWFVTAARAASLAAIDKVEIELGDEAYLREQCTDSAGLGFAGKQVIHPTQLAPVHAAFRPTAERLAWAAALREAHAAAGQGAFRFRGQMIDAPTLLAADSMLAMANALRQVDVMDAAAAAAAGSAEVKASE